MEQSVINFGQAAQVNSKPPSSTDQKPPATMSMGGIPQAVMRASNTAKPKIIRKFPAASPPPSQILSPTPSISVQPPPKLKLRDQKPVQQLKGSSSPVNPSLVAPSHSYGYKIPISLKTPPPCQPNNFSTSLHQTKHPSSIFKQDQEELQNSLPNISLKQDLVSKPVPQSYPVPIRKQHHFRLNTGWYKNQTVQLRWENFSNAPFQIRVILDELSSLYVVGKETVGGHKGLKHSKHYSTEPRPPQVVASAPKQYADRAYDYKGDEKLSKAITDFSNKFHRKLYYRSIRGDGNCFYRAFVYAYLEQALLTPFATPFVMMLIELNNRRLPYKVQTKEPIQLSDLTPDERKMWVMRRLLQLFNYRLSLSSRQVNKDQRKAKLVEALVATFNEPGFIFDMCLCVAIRNLCPSMLIDDKIRNVYGSECVDSAIWSCNQYGLECNQNELLINLLAQRFKTRVELVQEQKARADKVLLTTYGARDFAYSLTLLFTPGHYQAMCEYSIPRCSSQNPSQYCY